MRLVSYCTVHQSLLGESIRLCHSFAVDSYHPWAWALSVASSKANAFPRVLGCRELCIM